MDYWYVWDSWAKKNFLREETEPLTWSPENEKAFISVKRVLVSAPALGLPDYSKPFELFVHERQGVASGVLPQKLGPHRRPVAYYSTQLDAVIKGTPGCIRAIAATAALIEKTRPVVCETNGKLLMLTHMLYRNNKDLFVRVIPFTFVLILNKIFVILKYIPKKPLKLYLYILEKDVFV
uniref:Reverse transcriptase/retrotransposon-derived protein RNase H-like domain-containing protein n=1 Tax=Apteryx owenii TaxID=8824 RepID=A0A8B9PNA2_APTOW